MWIPTDSVAETVSPDRPTLGPIARLPFRFRVQSMQEEPTNQSKPRRELKPPIPATRYSNDILEDLKQKLTDYLEEKNIFLYPSGRSFAGLCPLHDDTKPSFSVFGESNQMWKCFGCDQCGNVFQLSIALGCANTFPEAVREVASTLGIKLPTLRKGNFRVPTRRMSGMEARTPHRAIVEQSLNEEQEASHWVARHHLREALRLEPNRMQKIADELGLPLPVIKRAARGKSGLGLVDDKLAYVYPKGLKIRNQKGKEPRFVWLFGRATAPWRFDRVGPETTTIYLTEGESDTLAIIATGVEDDRKSVAVASPGTSFSVSWAPLFSGKHVVICFDFDPPGRAAAQKVAGILSPHAASIRITRHPM